MGVVHEGPDATAFLRSRMNAIYRMQLPMVAMNTFGAFLIASYFWNLPGGSWLYVWFAFLCAGALPRAGFAVAYRLKRFADVRPLTWAYASTFFAAEAGFLWALAVGWTLAVGNDNQVMFVVCVALAAVAMSIANIVYWPVYAVFAGPLLAASSAGLALSNRPGHVALASAAAILAAMLMLVSRSLTREVLRGYRLALANEALASSLTERGRELEGAMETLEQLTRTDPLTGLGNRRLRDARLGAEWERAQRLGSPLTVIAIDVDHFKSYNDSHGHDEGDRALTAVAAMLAKGTRGAIDIAARHGGEEFMLILPGIGAEAATSVAERVRGLVSHCHKEFGLPQQVTASLGVATTVPAAGHDPAELTVAADAALYRAKLAGRNCYVIATVEELSAAA